jgi:hypothetical protein
MITFLAYTGLWLMQQGVISAIALWIKILLNRKHYLHNNVLKVDELANVEDHFFWYDNGMI